MGEMEWIMLGYIAGIGTGLGVAGLITAFLGNE